MVVNLSAGVKAKLANAKLAQAGSTATVPVPTPTTPTPVATPVSPTPTTPTTPTPVTPNTTPVTPTPTQPTPVAKTDTVQPSVLPDFQDNSDKRLKEIQMNLDKYAKTNPEMFANQDNFKQSFSYNQRSNEQKGVLDAFYMSQLKKNKEIDDAKNTQLAQQKLITDLQVMPVQDMVDKWLSQEQVTSLATNNPEKFAQYQKAKEDKIKLDTINGELSKNPMQEIIDKFKNATFEVPQLQEMFTEKMKVLEPQQLELNAKKWELTQIQDEMDNILNDTRSELEGTGATDSYIRALASKRMQEITPVYNAKLREYNTILDDYQVKANNIEQEMGFAKDQFTMNQQAQQQQMSQLWFAMELMNYQSPQQKADMDFKQFVRKTQYEEWDINSNDPLIRNRAISKAATEFTDTYKGLVKSTPIQIAERIKKDMSSGKTYQESMTSIMEDLKQNKNYEAYMDAKAWVDNTIKLVESGGVTWKMDSKGNLTPLPTAENQSIVDYATSIKGKNMQCGEFVNTYIQQATWNYWSVWTWFDDKVAWLSKIWLSDIPVVWWLFAFPWNTVYWDTGHTGIITSVNWNQVTVLEANRENKKEGSAPKEWTYTINDQWKFSVPPSSQWWDPAKLPQYIEYMEGWKLPVWMKDWTVQAEQFRNQAQWEYIKAKNQAFKTQWFEIKNPEAFVSTSTAQKKAIDTAITNVQPFLSSMDALIKTVNDNKWTVPTKLSASGMDINQKTVNAQLLAKEVYNLWVLNWPDLVLMQSIIPNVTTLENMTKAQWLDFWKVLSNAKSIVLNNAINQGKWAGLEFIQSKERDAQLKEKYQWILQSNFWLNLTSIPKD